MSPADFVPCPSVQPGPATSVCNDVHAMYRAVRAQSAGGRGSRTARKSRHDVDHAIDG
jgi:hypothetical protein